MLAAGSSRSVAAWSVAAYAVVTLAWLCYVAYERAHGGTETMLHAGVNVIAALVLPALTGFGVGRWWAFLLASWLIPAALLAQMLEPPFEEVGEMNSGAGLTAVIALFVHVPLLLVGAAASKLVRRRRGRR